MKLNEAYSALRRRLARITDEAAPEAALLFSRFMGVRSPALTPDAEADEARLAELFSALERREKGEPIQYVLGSWGFMGLEFTVSPEALIPRQDTETLCEEALRLISERGYKTLLDICTGTGCIAVSLASISGIRTEASDVSPACAALARRNAERNGVDMTVRTADLFEGAGRYDIVTANPPYIPDAELDSLQREVAFEPRLALAGGPDGLALYRRIAAEAEAHVTPGGALLMEVGLGEARSVAALFPKNTVRILPDLNGIERVVEVFF